MIMSAIGIIMVVDAHSWSAVHIGDAIFPYNSFFMAMFFFISGYFFKPKLSAEDLTLFICRKTKTLFAPYLGWWFAYLLIGIILGGITSFKYAPTFSFYNYFVGPIVCGEFGGLNAPAYFVPILFYVICLHSVARFVFNRIWNDYVCMIIYICMGAFVVWYSISIDYKYAYNSAFMMLMKVMFSLQFYELGTMYNSKIENSFNRIHPIVIIIVTTCIISIIKHFVPEVTWLLNRLYFSTEYEQLGYCGYLMPLVTSILGIAFWLEISKILVPAIGDSKICNFISNHTFGIMEHHIFCMALLNIFLVKLNMLVPINGIDVDTIKTSAWYRFEWGGSEDFYVFYFLAGIIGSCLICLLVDRTKQLIAKRS